MLKRILVISALLYVGVFCLRAQDIPVGGQSVPARVMDGPGVEVDSASVKPAREPAKVFSMMPGMRMTSPLFPGEEMYFETAEQRAAKINALTRTLVMSSMGQSLYWERIPDFTLNQMALLYAAAFFSASPYAFPQDCVPLMNHSFPFIYAKTPGMAPYEQMYSPDIFPQCIRSEYDAFSGKYKQVMVDWTEYQKNYDYARRFKAYNVVAPVPKIAVTPVERAMRQHP